MSQVGIYRPPGVRCSGWAGCADLLVACAELAVFAVAPGPQRAVLHCRRRVACAAGDHDNGRAKHFWPAGPRGHHAARSASAELPVLACTPCPEHARLADRRRAQRAAGRHAAGQPIPADLQLAPLQRAVQPVNQRASCQPAAEDFALQRKVCMQDAGTSAAGGARSLAVVRQHVLRGPAPGHRPMGAVAAHAAARRR